MYCAIQLITLTACLLLLPVAVGGERGPLLSERPPEHQLALVIGDIAYQTVPLYSPVNDAYVERDVLPEMGLEVIYHGEVHAAGMFQAGQKFGPRLKREGRVQKNGYTTQEERIQVAADDRLTVRLGKWPRREGPRIARDRFKDGTPGPEMVFIKGGCYQMGSPSTESGRDDNELQHRVCVHDFWLGKHEVTQGLWEAVMESNPSKFKKGANYPVEQVSWEDVQKFIDKLNRRTGNNYWLPTEAEWEYAARAGTQTAYWWETCASDEYDCSGTRVSHEYANYGKDRCCGGVARGRDRWEDTAPVGSFQANPWGLHDTAGNVHEWTCSAYFKHYHGNEQRCASLSVGGQRAVRGGSWNTGPQELRSARRFGLYRGHRVETLGFRLARE